MEPEMNNQNWNEPSQTQPVPCEQPQSSSTSIGQWLQQTWLNVRVATWLKCLIIVVVLVIAAAYIAPKFASADNQQQNSTSTFTDMEQQWYDYDDYEDYYGEY